MSDWTAPLIFVAIACLAFAVAVWVFVRTALKSDRTRPVATGSRGGRTAEYRRMQAGDWFNAAINLAIGLLLGSFVDGLIQLVATGLWLSAAILTLLFGGLFLVVSMSDKLLDPLFSIGVRPAPKAGAKGRTPSIRRMSLPVGLVLGVALARLGLDDRILTMIP